MDLFTDAVRYTSFQLDKPFNFLISARRRDCDFIDYVEYLSNFTRIAISTKIRWMNVTRFITSTILLDAYAPRLYRTWIYYQRNVLHRLNNHVGFDPIVVFTNLY